MHARYRPSTFSKRKNNALRFGRLPQSSPGSVGTEAARRRWAAQKSPRKATHRLPTGMLKISRYRAVRHQKSPKPYSPGALVDYHIHQFCKRGQTTIFPCRTVNSSENICIDSGCFSLPEEKSDERAIWENMQISQKKISLNLQTRGERQSEQRKKKKLCSRFRRRASLRRVKYFRSLKPDNRARAVD